MNLVIRRMSIATIALVICCILLPQKIYARVDCTNPPDCYVSGTTGFVGTGFANVFTNDPQFDTARFTSTTGYDLWVTSDVRMTVPYKLLEKMYFDGDSANNPQRMDVKFSSSIIDGGSFVQDSGESRTLETSQLNLNHVNFTSAKVYPNPSTGVITIEEGQDSNLRVYNMLGKLVYTQSLIDQTQSVDLSSLSKGVYIIQLVNGNSIMASKLIIDK